MARFEVFAERQPWEEQQVESPTHDHSDLSPLELALSRTRSRTHSPTSPLSPTFSPPTSPTSPKHVSRRLSSTGQPPDSPTAWKRRASLSPQKSAISTSPEQYSPPFVANSPPLQPVQRSPPPGQQLQRRPPQNLVMTRAGVAQRLLRENEPAHLRVPVRAAPGSYRRRAGTTSTTASNRSSLHSQDGGPTSEDLWNMDDDAPDMSNPMRAASERPLDTVNRMSQRFEPPIYPMGVEVLWPTAPPEIEYQPPPKSRSLTNVTAIKSMKRRSGTLRKRDSQGSAMNIPYEQGTTISPTGSKDGLSSAHSSTTSLSMPTSKSQASLNTRPASYSYSLDLLSTLMPREGGYALAAQIGYGDAPRSTPPVASPPNSYRGPRGPAAKSSGMRWSVDPDEYYAPPVPGGRLSPATTVSSLGDEYDNSAPGTPQYTSAPVAPSPLSQQTTADEFVNGAPSPVPNLHTQPSRNVPPVPSVATASALAVPAAAAMSRSKTKKERKADEKAAKAEAKRLVQEKADADAKAKVEDRRLAHVKYEAEAKAKVEAARKEKELKALAKADAAKKKDESRLKGRSLRKVPSFRRKSMIGTESAPAIPTDGSSRVPSTPVAATAASVVIPQRSTSAAPRPSTMAGPPSAPVPAAALAVAPSKTTPVPAATPVPIVAVTAPTPVPRAEAPVQQAGPTVAPTVVPTTQRPAVPSPAPVPAPAPVQVPAPTVAPAPAPAAVSKPAVVAAAAAAGAASVVAAAAIGRGPAPSPAAPPAKVTAPTITPVQHAPKPAPSTPPASQRMPMGAPAQRAPVTPGSVPSIVPVHRSPASGPGRATPHAPQRAPVAVPQQQHRMVSAPGPVQRGPNMGPTPMPAQRVPSGSPPPRTPQKSTPPTIVVPSPGPTRRTPSPSVSMTSASASTIRASNSSQASATPAPAKKGGLFSSLKKRFSISSLNDSNPPAVPGKPRPQSVVVQDKNSKQLPKLPPAPVVNNARRTAAPTQVNLPPPIVVPPRQSSLATTNPLSPIASYADVDGSDRPSSMSNPSSVVVTPTASMAATSAGSLFEVRPTVIRERSDSATSASASNVTDHDMGKAPAVSQLPSAVAAH